MKTKNVLSINLKYYSIISLLTFIFFSCSKDNNPTAPVEQNPIYSEIDKLTDSLINVSKVPGLVVGIWAPDRNIEWVKAKGLADLSKKRDMKTTDLFRIGSITKTFTITIILQLVDEGKLALDDKLSKFFPDFPNGENITIRELCNMTSGIYNYTDTEELAEVINTDPGRKFQPQELVDMAKNKTPYFEPGQGYFYSNTNTILLGMIIEKLTGNQLQAEMKNRLFTKLNLNVTYFPTERNMPGEYAHGYELMDTTSTISADVSELLDPSWGWAAGAIVSNLADVKTWIESLAKGTLISAASQNERLKCVQITDKFGYGLGLFNAVGFIGHDGSVPGYVTCAVHSPAKNTTIIVLFNSSYNAEPTLFCLKLISKLYPELLPDLSKDNSSLNRIIKKINFCDRINKRQ